MAEPLKDILFNARTVTAIADQLEKVVPKFAKKDFTRAILEKLPELELKQRTEWIARRMQAHLGQDYPKALQVLLQSLPNDKDRGQLSGFDDFLHMPHVTFVELFGLAHPDLSLQALYRLTKYFTGEGAIRPYLLQHYDKTMACLQKWVSDEDWRVRRLVSEGTRPRLPWAPRLPMFIKDPTPVLALLENLQDDPHEVVRRSVANNLNDIAKDHPDLVADTVARWVKGAGKEKQVMIRHGLRTLIKQGHGPSLAVLGFAGQDLRLTKLTLTPKELKMGSSLSFHADLVHTGKEGGRFVLDYAIHFLGSRGQHRRKVFKGNVVHLRPKEKYNFASKHKIAPITTRTYYPGAHWLELIANGKSLGKEEFTLKIDNGRTQS